MDGKWNIAMAKLQLMTTFLTGDTTHLIVHCPIFRHVTNTCTLVAHDVSTFHPLTDQSNLHAIGCLDFSICKRKNLSYDKLPSVPMHVLPLGMQKFIPS